MTKQTTVMLPMRASMSNKTISGQDLLKKRTDYKLTPGPDSIATVKDLSRLYPAFSVRSIRYLIEKKSTNGFGKCILRIGRRIYIDLDYFEKWLEERRQK